MEDLIDVLGRCLIVDGRGCVSSQHVENGHSPERGKPKISFKTIPKVIWKNFSFENLHASHFRFANVSITVEIVETENPPQLLLDRPARGLRQRLEEILFCQNQSKLKECQMYVFNSNENTSNLMVPVPPFLNVLNT